LYHTHRIKIRIRLSQNDIVHRLENASENGLIVNTAAGLTLSFKNVVFEL